jgi:hypothetical protein
MEVSRDTTHLKKLSQRRSLGTEVVTSLASCSENTEVPPKKQRQDWTIERNAAALYVAGALYVKGLHSVNRNLL